MSKRRTVSYGMSMEERENSKSAGRLRMMGESARKLKRASLAHAEIVKEQAIAPTVIVMNDAAGVSEVEAPTQRKSRKKVVSPYPDAFVLLAQLTNIFVNLLHVYEKADADVNRFDHAMGDLAHALELLHLTKREQVKITDEIKQNRIERRKAKEFMAVVRPLYDIVRAYPTMVGALKAAELSMIRLADVSTRRTYTPRVRQDLQALFANSKVTKVTSEGSD